MKFFLIIVQSAALYKIFIEEISINISMLIIYSDVNILIFLEFEASSSAWRPMLKIL
jgi:hypothetical protein